MITWSYRPAHGSCQCWKAAFRFLSLGLFEYRRANLFLWIMSVHGSVYVYLAIRVNTFGSINVFLWQRTDYVSEFLFCFRGKAIHFFFNGRKSEAFISGTLAWGLSQGGHGARMISPSAWETWRPAERRSRHIIFTQNHSPSKETYLHFLIIHWLDLRLSFDSLSHISQSKTGQHHAVTALARGIKSLAFCFSVLFSDLVIERLFTRRGGLQRSPFPRMHYSWTDTESCGSLSEEK